MINKILLQLCIWLIYRQVVMHQHFQKCAYRLNAAERKMWRRLLSDA